MDGRVLKAAVLVSLVFASACADIRFERGPYAVRDLEVVYSVQEDATFVFWRLRNDAKLSLVDFELWIDGGYTPIDLTDAPFAAEPFACGSTWCFQYQLPGRWELPTDTSPIRSIHRDDGVFMGPSQREQRVRTTFGTSPIGLGHNDAIDPRRFDWFAENEIQLRRPYEWQFTPNTDDGCEEPGSSWKPSGDPIQLESAWTDDAAENGICFHLRPVRADGGASWESAVLFPSAETTAESQRYMPARVDAPVIWGLLLDLHVPDPSRCTQVKGRLIDMLEQHVGSRSDDVTKLGIYTPIDAENGDELTGCEQSATREYPIERMLAAAAQARGERLPEETRVLWVIANNIELPPSDRIVEQLQLFGLALAFGDDVDPENLPEWDGPVDVDIGIGGIGTTSFAWAIGSNVFMSLLPWDLTTPWRPIEDETFAADIRSAARATLPFATMQHDPIATEVPLRQPDDASSRPEMFKLCEATPFSISAIGLEPGLPVFEPNQTVRWPGFDDNPPYYMVDIPPQILVPRTQYVRQTEDVVLEVCTRFCGGPFRTRNGTDLTNWSSTRACQWER